MQPTVTVDIGTTRIKLSYFDTDGRQLASEKVATPSRRDEWGFVYDVDALVGTVEAFFRNLDEAHLRSVRRVAIAGVGESGGLVDPDLHLHSPMILWHDHRGASILARLTPDERRLIYRVTGLPVNANYALSKMAWASQHLPDTDVEVRWLNVSEFLAAHMTGQRWAEYSLASRTMALDLRAGVWSQTMCDLVGIDQTLLPELRSAAEGAPVSARFAAAVGLDDSVAVHVAGHDHMVGAVGAGLRPGEVLNSTGTTEGVLMLREQPDLDEDAAAAMLSNGRACDGELFTLFASIPTGGSAYATLQRMLGMSASTLAACVARLHERYLTGSVDLGAVPIVVPHFRGSPPPEKSASARAIIAHVGDETTAEDIVFGTFLGMALQLRKVLNLFRSSASTIKVIGPASANPLWLSLKADVLNSALSVSEFPEVVSRGAQALASARTCSWLECHPTTVEPDADRHQRLLDWRSAIQPTLQDLRDLSW